MKITVVPHDRLNLVQFKIRTPKGETIAETTSGFLEIDVPCDEKQVDIQYRYLDNRHQPVTDWIVKQEARWMPKSSPNKDPEPETEPDTEIFDPKPPRIHHKKALEE